MFNELNHPDMEGLDEVAKIEPWQAGCSDYYRSPSGRVVTRWPHRMSDLKRVLDAADLDVYETAAR
jgi:hypothetical protein